MAEENYHEVIAELRERLAYLESELGLSNKAELTWTYQQTFGLTAQEARTLIALMQAKGRILTYAQLEDAMEREHAGVDTKICRVHVSRIRKAVGFDTIENIPEQGYRITPHGQDRLTAQLGLPPLYSIPVAYLAKA